MPADREEEGCVVFSFLATGAKRIAKAQRRRRVAQGGGEEQKLERSASREKEQCREHDITHAAQLNCAATQHTIRILALTVVEVTPHS